MIIGRNFVFVLAPKSASTSIRQALRRHGVLTWHFHDYLKGVRPPQPVVAAVDRPWGDALRSAWRMNGSKGDCEKWITKEQVEPEFKVIGEIDMRDLDQDLYFRHVTHRLRWSRLQQDWADFLEDAGLPQIELGHVNKSKVMT